MIVTATIRATVDALALVGLRWQQIESRAEQLVKLHQSSGKSLRLQQGPSRELRVPRRRHGGWEMAGDLGEQQVGESAEELRGANSSSIDLFWVRGPASRHHERRDPSSFELIVMCPV